MNLNPKVTDAALFAYPEFVGKSLSLTTPGKGIRLTPPNSKPGSTVENIIISRETSQNVVEAIDCAMATLDQDRRWIIEVKFGWHYEGNRLVTTVPEGSKQAYATLVRQGYKFSERTYFDQLGEVRDRVGRYLDSLGGALYAAFGTMPKKKRMRKFTDEEFKQAKEFLEERKVKFVEEEDGNEEKPP